MGGRISMYVLLVCVWCSLDAGGFLMVVTAQPTVYAEILTPEADRKEGGQVDMRCTATNLESHHIVEWRTEDPILTLRWGGATVNNKNGRFIFNTSVDTATQTVVQDFTITNVQRADTDEYVCNVNDPLSLGGSLIVATSNVTLSVLYFPSASFPMCSPAGPITVDAGTVLGMRCSSESSHGKVTMTTNATIQTSRYTNWTSVINDDSDTVVRTSDLTVDNADNGVVFECFISSMYFAGMHGTCQIGPITVRNTVTIPMTEPTTSSTSTSSTAGSTRPSIENPTLTTENEVASTSSSTTQSTSATSFSPAVIAGAVVGGVAAFLLLVILIRICYKRRSGNPDPKSEQFNADINQTNTDLTLEQSQVSFNEYGDLDSIQHGLQDNIIYVPSPSPISGPGESYAGTLPVQTAETIDPSLIYAKPFRTKTQKTERELKKQQSDPNDNPTTDQSYNNPAFHSNVSSGTTSPYWDDSPTPTPAASVRSTRPSKPTPYKPNPSQRNTLGKPTRNDNPVIESSVSDGPASPPGVDLSTSIKPIALVRPTRPSKPRPYKPKQAERMSDAPSIHADRMVPSPPPLTSVNDGTPSLETTDDSPYAQDSAPMRQQSSHGNPASEDHIVYADLDLQSDEIQDGGHHPQPASDAVLYSSVVIN